MKYLLIGAVVGVLLVIVRAQEEQPPQEQEKPFEIKCMEEFKVDNSTAYPLFGAEDSWRGGYKKVTITDDVKKFIRCVIRYYGIITESGDLDEEEIRASPFSFDELKAIPVTEDKADYAYQVYANISEQMIKLANEEEEATTEQEE